MKNLIGLLLFLSILSNPIFAQNTDSIAVANTCPCCDNLHSQFDFWIGEWNVTDTTGTQIGENIIQKIEKNCIITETWTGGTGFTGSSFNYYDSSDSTWNQLWIDMNGSILKLKGELINNAMVMKGDLQENNEGNLYYNQITWTPQENGSVIQVWETYDKNHQLVSTLFVGIYIKKE